MMPQITRNLLIWSISITLAGCAHLQKPSAPPSQPAKSWPSRQNQLAQQKNWNIKGSIGVRTADKGTSASFNWRQQQHAYFIELFGPLGINRAMLTGTGNQVTLQTADKKTYVAKDSEALLRERYGWYLPVNNLYYWVRGLPAPHSSADVQLDANKRLATLHQQGWQIRYNSYTNTNGLELPEKMTLDRGKLHIRMVIRQWQLNS